MAIDERVDNRRSCMHSVDRDRQVPGAQRGFITLAVSEMVQPLHHGWFDVDA